MNLETDITVVYEALTGSLLYGLSDGNSDVDLVRIFVPRLPYLISADYRDIYHPNNNMTEHKGVQDIKYMSLNAFVAGLFNTKMNCLELLSDIKPVETNSDIRLFLHTLHELNRDGNFLKNLISMVAGIRSAKFGNEYHKLRLMFQCRMLYSSGILTFPFGKIEKTILRKAKSGDCASINDTEMAYIASIQSSMNTVGFTTNTEKSGIELTAMEFMAAVYRELI